MDSGKRTALHIAAYRGETLCGLALIRLGASIDQLDDRGNTPVTAAIAAGFRECAKALEDEALRPRPAA